MNDKKSEGELALIDIWISRVHEISKIVIGLFFAALISYFGLLLERYSTTKDYLLLLSDNSSPTYLKGMVFSSMLRNSLIEPDILFTAAYRAESELGQQSILKDLFYEYADYENPLDIPIGHIDLVRAQVDGAYVSIPGWALDKEGDICSTCIFVAIDGVEHRGEIEISAGDHSREDIKSFFAHYEYNNKAGFKIKIPINLLKGNTHKLWVRINNTRRKFMDIFDAEVSLSDSKLVHIHRDQGNLDGKSE